mgnify:CR=1 FL=1
MPRPILDESAIHPAVRAQVATHNAAIVAGIRKNASPTELAALNERVETLVGTIRQAGSASAGDVINFDYQPDVGTVFLDIGAADGNMFAEPLFAAQADAGFITAESAWNVFVIHH